MTILVPRSYANSTETRARLAGCQSRVADRTGQPGHRWISAQENNIPMKTHPHYTDKQQTFKNLKTYCFAAVATIFDFLIFFNLVF